MSRCRSRACSVLDLVAAAAGRVLLAAAGRLRRRRDQGRGHRAGRLRPLVAAALRGRRPRRAASALFLALNRGKRSIRIDLKTDAGKRGAAAPGAGRRRAARVVPPGRARPPRRRLRAAAPGEPAAGLLRDHRLRPGRAQPRPLGPRHELPRPQRAPRPDRRRRRAAGPGRRPDRRPRRRGADGGVRDPDRAARARALGRGPARRLLDVRRRRCRGWRWWPPRCSPTRPDARARRAAAGRRVHLLPPLPVRRRLRHARRAGAEVLGRASADGVGREDLLEHAFDPPGSDAHRDGVARSSPRAPASSGAQFASEHDCCLEPVLELDEALRLRAGGGARDGRRARPAGRGAAGQAARAADQARAARRATRPGRRDRRSASTPTRCWPAPASAPRRSPRCTRPARSPGRPTARAGLVPAGDERDCRRAC